MNCTSFGRNFIRSLVCALATGIAIFWIDGLSAGQPLIIFLLWYIVMLVHDVGTELTERFKQQGAYIEDDPEWDDDDAAV
jgi:hypothetical protein